MKYTGRDPFIPTLLPLDHHSVAQGHRRYSSGFILHEAPRLSHIFLEVFLDASPRITGSLDRNLSLECTVQVMIQGPTAIPAVSTLALDCILSTQLGRLYVANFADLRIAWIMPVPHRCQMTLASPRHQSSRRYRVQVGVASSVELKPYRPSPIGFHFPDGTGMSQHPAASCSGGIYHFCVRMFRGPSRSYTHSNTLCLASPSYR